jgi:hypothetical protein
MDKLDSETSEAARALSRQRWGATKLVRFADELTRRRDELPADALEQLRRAFGDTQQPGGTAA